MTIAVFVLVVMACMMKIIWGKKNENQQNLFHSNRIGTGIEKKHNQSETVTRALRKYLDPDTDSSIGDATTHQLMAVLTNRIDVDEGLKALLLQVLSKRF